MYSLENFSTFLEINRTIDEYNILLHSSISSIFIVALEIKQISHSIISE